ncbi:hypothetical protein AvCA_01430 [Azotobacter vinelandii CA]|uniref:DUF6129 domain-containing protein n=3 Tax=Azotobacter group TaxID=351 RepID=C1DH01_AZOVD|nr:DUF6129 family protein [Azotobacter vinelandii]ACO76408.1 conserved hypothetical protein [Azotobacter vinelandii DJ]AGK15684.1 hypothetical protein AvCA_01430 [Azotobacter vinelandii CA]AGK19107.1 hypothetical protein AvCA6_01430 [Azotobacter vinelandii CA6]WKN22187.1 DUF6129 family protein [Azotobacter vinelandii]SFX76785.1 hypothetical protein SAMN04244547_02695 [Azotobacter vinelandii]
MISQTLLDDVVRQAEQGVLGESLLASLRSAHPGVHFTCCMDDDVVVNAKPVVERPGFNVYLVNSCDHCSVLTNDLDSASGIVLAEIIED